MPARGTFRPLERQRKCDAQTGAAALGVGVGANGLVGGSNSFALQTWSCRQWLSLCTTIDITATCANSASDHD
jgi:hypothetical protein